MTFYHRNGICYFRSKAYSEFSGTPGQLEQKRLHQRAIAAWRSLSLAEQNLWRRFVAGVAAHRPPFGDGNSMSGYNLFLSAYHGFAQLCDEHVPLPQRFEAFPIFSLDFAGCRHDTGKLELEFNLTLCGTDMPERYSVFGKIQLDIPGAGRNPGKMRNYLSDSVPSGKVSKIIFSVPAESRLDMYQIHVRYLLLDSVTGYRSQYHSLSALACPSEESGIVTQNNQIEEHHSCGASAVR